MEHEDRLPGGIVACRRLRLVRVETEEELLHARGRIDVDGAGDVAAVVLGVEAAVDDVELVELRIVGAIEELVELCGRT